MKYWLFMKQEFNFLNCKIWILITHIIVYRIQFELRKQYFTQMEFIKYFTSYYLGISTLTKSNRLWNSILCFDFFCLRYIYIKKNLINNKIIVFVRCHFDHHNFCITKQDKFHYYLLVDAIILFLFIKIFMDVVKFRTIYFGLPYITGFI